MQFKRNLLKKRGVKKEISVIYLLYIFRFIMIFQVKILYEILLISNASTNTKESQPPLISFLYSAAFSSRQKSLFVDSRSSYMKMSFFFSTLSQTLLSLSSHFFCNHLKFFSGEFLVYYTCKQKLP